MNACNDLFDVIMIDKKQGETDKDKDRKIENELLRRDIILMEIFFMYY